jgi:preprotein translocase subunit YajC
MALLVDSAWAQTAEAAAGPTMWEQLVLPIGLVIIMYFLIFRPQAKKAKEQHEFLAQLKPGDEVVTSGGLIGKIRAVAEDFVTLDLGSTSVKVVKDNLSRRAQAKPVKETSSGK